MTEDEWDSVFAVDLKAAWMLAKAALPGLIERRGAIVNISSIQARLTLHGFFPYAAAKSGLEGLTRSLALDYAAAGVRVNAVAPGYTDTRLVQEWLGLQDDPDATLRSVLANIPLGRMAAPREIGNAVVFLLSDHASAITGETLAVDLRDRRALCDVAFNEKEHDDPERRRSCARGSARCTRPRSPT